MTTKVREVDYELHARMDRLILRFDHFEKEVSLGPHLHIMENMLKEHEEFIKKQDEYNKTCDRITIDHEGRITIFEAQIRKDT